MGLLDQYAGRKLQGTPVGQGVQYIGGLLGNAVNAAAAGLDKRNKTISRAWEQPNNEQAQRDAYAATMDFAGLAPLGMTVWHGSPHKFTKFDMSKIGTGEGAQAYGHGLYTAEAQQVGKEYADKLAGDYYKAGGELFNPADIKHLNVRAMVRNGDLDGAIQKAATIANSDSGVANLAKLDLDLLQKAKEAGGLSKAEGYLYKVDIPDEAVARFLDWDKKLTDQAPEVLDAIKKSSAKYGPVRGNAPIYSDAAAPYMTGHDFYRDLANALSDGGVRRGSTALTGQDAIASQHLRELGIPGIRYLDGGSRTAGSGSSNFVLFDDAMARILETNGKATGLMPWKPNEYGLLNP